MIIVIIIIKNKKLNSHKECANKMKQNWWKKYNNKTVFDPNIIRNRNIGNIQISTKGDKSREE